MYGNFNCFSYLSLSSPNIFFKHDPCVLEIYIEYARQRYEQYSFLHILHSHPEFSFLHFVQKTGVIRGFIRGVDSIDLVSIAVIVK